MPVEIQIWGKTDPKTIPYVPQHKIDVHSEAGQLLAMVRRDPHGGTARHTLLALSEVLAQEANNVLFCPSQEKFHTVILKAGRQYS